MVQKRKVADHEAGHAVVGRHFGLRPRACLFRLNSHGQTDRSSKYGKVKAPAVWASLEP